MTELKDITLADLNNQVSDVAAIKIFRNLVISFPGVEEPHTFLKGELVIKHLLNSKNILLTVLNSEGYLTKPSIKIQDNLVNISVGEGAVGTAYLTVITTP